MIDGLLQCYNTTRCKEWFLSQVGKAIDCNSMIIGPNPVGTSIFKQKSAPVAQLDRVSGYEPGGYEFDSCQARHRDVA